MSKRRVRSDKAGAPRHQDQAAVPDRLEFVARHQDGPGRLRRLDQDLVLAGLGEHQEAAVAQGRDGGQGRLGEPRPVGPARARLEPELLGAAEHFRCADSGRSKPMPDLFAIGGNALEAQQRHEGFEPRISRRGAVGFGAHARSPGLVVFGSGVRLRQQRRLVRGRIGDRRPALAGARRDEARRHELAEQGETGGMRGGRGGVEDDVVARSAVEDVLRRRPISTSSPAPPVSVSLPWLPIRTSSPSPPLAVSSMPDSPDASMTSSPPRPLMTMRSLASKSEIVTVVGETRHRDHAVVVGDVDHVVAVGRVDDDRVRLRRRRRPGRC